MRMLKAMDLCQLVSAVAALSAVSMGCSNPSDEGTVEDKTGRLSLKCVGGTSTHDVTGVAFVVVGAEGSCADTPIASTTTPTLESESIPASLLPSGGGSAHPFADGLFVLAPGDYRVCATPLTDAGPSADCGPADVLVNVKPELTTEVVLMSQCKGDPNGGLDVVLGLNAPPTINTLNVAPSKFITVCEKATITVGATDANGDTMTYSGTILSGPPGTPGSLSFAANVGTFTPGSPGDYQVKVTVTDAVGGSTSLQLPIHVSTAQCTLVSLVGDKDNFVPGNPADIPAVDPAFLAAAVADQIIVAPTLDDELIVDMGIVLSHIFTLPAGAVVQGATLQVHLRPSVKTNSSCADTDFIRFDTVFKVPTRYLAIHDLVGGMPVPGQDYTFDIDLAATPVRDVLTTQNAPYLGCQPWSDVANPAPIVQINLLPNVQSGLLNLLMVDDTGLDYSQLTVQYTIP
jgi:hypothetical protein